MGVRDSGSWLTVIVPCHNHASYLPDCLGSLLAQPFSRWECIVVDDGSTDETASIACQAASADGRIRCVSQVNGGAGSARNTGLSLARGDWIAFMDADDYYLPGAFRHFFSAAQAHPSARIIVGQLAMWGASAEIGAAGMERADLFFSALMFEEGPWLLLQNSTFRRDLIEEAGGGFVPGLRTSEDLEFYIRMAALSEAVVVAAPVGYYRVEHGHGKSERYLASGEKVAVHRRIYGALLDHPLIERRLPPGADRRRFLRMREAYLAMLDCADALREGNPRSGAHHLSTMARSCETASEQGILTVMLKYFLFYPRNCREQAVARVSDMLDAVVGVLPPGEEAGARALTEALRRKLIAPFSPARTTHLPPRSSSLD
jgi:glycosyltransferase involved in cell wall biosynthesis